MPARNDSISCVPRLELANPSLFADSDSRCTDITSYAGAYTKVSHCQALCTFRNAGLEEDKDKLLSACRACTPFHELFVHNEHMGLCWPSHSCAIYLSQHFFCPQRLDFPFSCTSSSDGERQLVGFSLENRLFETSLRFWSGVDCHWNVTFLLPQVDRLLLEGQSCRTSSLIFSLSNCGREYSGVDGVSCTAVLQGRYHRCALWKEVVCLSEFLPLL